MNRAVSRRRSYGQACNIARTLDIVGERWTLLLLRELFVSPKTYGDLAEALPGIGTNLLAARLKQMETDGLIAREQMNGVRNRHVYNVTESGRLLKPVLIEMIRFGSRVGLISEADEFSRPDWYVLASDASFNQPYAAGLNEHYEFHVGDSVFHLGVSDGSPDNGIGAAPSPVVTVSMKPEIFERLERGSLKLSQGVWNGDIEVVGGHAGALDRCEQVFCLGISESSDSG